MNGANDAISKVRGLVAQLAIRLQREKEPVDITQNDWQERAESQVQHFRESANSELGMIRSIVLKLGNPVSLEKIREVRDIMRQEPGLVDYIFSPPLWALKSEPNERVILEGAVTHLVMIGDDESRDGLLSSQTLFHLVDGRSDSFRSSLTAVWDELERHRLLAKHWSVLRKKLT